MPALPERSQQIVQIHAGLICQVVQTCHNRALMPALEVNLTQAQENGWTQLVNAIRQILNGRRDEQLLAGLDEEDHVIVDAILRGLQDPTTLPDPDAKPDASLAAPGLAMMIHAAANGDVQTLHALAGIATQMMKMGGDSARLGGNMKRLVDGERDPDALVKGMSPQGEQLMLKILEELGKLAAH